jgi:hypothetical protein
MKTKVDILDVDTMIKTWIPHFGEACKASFGFLVDDYGFHEPQIEQIGRECFVRYHKGARTVSISVEPGLLPIVEPFYPTLETGESAVPWAERNGVPRARRIPNLNIAGEFSSDSIDDVKEYVGASAKALIAMEPDFALSRQESCPLHYVYCAVHDNRVALRLGI